MLRHPVHFKSFLLWSVDILGLKYLKKKYSFDLRLYLLSLHCSDQTDCRQLNKIAFLNINFRYFRFRIYFNWDIFFIMGFLLLRHKITFYFAIFFISTISSEPEEKIFEIFPNLTYLDTEIFSAPKWSKCKISVSIRCKIS